MLSMKFGVICAAFIALGAGAGHAGPDTGPDLAVPEAMAKTPPSVQKSNSLVVLSPDDNALYRDIFSAQSGGDWKLADSLIGKLQDKSLIGHVLFQRYMHPVNYRSNYKELSKWMARYADLPGATRLYRLALKRRGSASRPKRPVPLKGNTASAAPTPAKTVKPRRSRLDRQAVASLESRLRREIRNGRPERGERYLWAFERRNLLTPLEFDTWLGQIAISHYHAGNDAKVLALATYAADRSGASIAQPDWIAGLAAWRLGECGIAADRFTRVSVALGADSWLRSAGAFWAARAHLICERPEKVEGLLRVAAKEDTTFYGILASRHLGLRPNFDWSTPELTNIDIADLTALPGVRRAIALVEVGQYKLADDELRLVFGRKGKPMWRPLIALAARLNLPAAQISLYRAAPGAADLPHSVRYPIPSWEPEGGFSIDRAMMFAIMRQESAFMPRAKSYADAYGLMQVTLNTASFLERDRSLRWSNKWKLFDPEFNMKLSQDYIHLLMDYEITDGNLFKFATAYNGGPGNLSRWDRKMKYGNDPLLFIESVPSRQTRIFIERILANLWIYRQRLGQPAPSLEAVAAGAWPPYESLDQDTARLAKGADTPERHAGN